MFYVCVCSHVYMCKCLHVCVRAGLEARIEEVKRGSESLKVVELQRRMLELGQHECTRLEEEVRSSAA